jgi:hypothetical protein
MSRAFAAMKSRRIKFSSRSARILGIAGQDTSIALRAFRVKEAREVAKRKGAADEPPPIRMK